MSTATVTPTPVVAGTFAIDRTHSEVLFRVRHLLSRVGGQFRDFARTIAFDPEHPEASSVELADVRRHQSTRRLPIVMHIFGPTISLPSTAIQRSRCRAIVPSEREPTRLPSAGR